MMFFEKIKDLREKHNKSQRKVATLGINVATYRKIEKGKQNITYEQIIVFARLFK